MGMQRIEAIEALLKGVHGGSEWNDASALEAVDVLMGAEDGRITSALVKGLIHLADNENVSAWIADNKVRTARDPSGKPANQVSPPVIAKRGHRH